MPPPAVQTSLHGWLGEAVEASRSARLSSFVRDRHSAPVALFDPEHADRHTAGDWYGEHVGKWLAAAALAGGPHLERARHIAQHLARWQRGDGYLGTSAPGHRFTDVPLPRAPSWDGAPARRTWDVWVHACLLGGLLAVHECRGDEPALAAARRIGDLAWQTFVERGLDITECGNHHGLSATVLLEPLVRLYEASGDERHLQLAEAIVGQADRRPELGLVRRVLAGADAAEIGTGKAYQLLWTAAGLARLYRANGDAALLGAALAIQRSVATQHLTPGGGPWGGVAHRSREVFNAPGFFSPQGFVETCATLAWLQLNRELLAATGDARHAEAIELSAYNDLLAAAAPGGEDWCYYSFPNGRRVHTTAWRCCKSSGALALEELAPLALQCVQGAGAGVELRVQLWGAADSVITFGGGARALLRQHTRYPADGTVRLEWIQAPAFELALALRIPSWAVGASVQVNGGAATVATAGGWHRLVRPWRHGDEVVLQMPMTPTLLLQQQRNVQESRAPDGQAVRQEVQCQRYAAFARGPLVYASGLVDGYKTQETLKLHEGPVEHWLREAGDDRSSPDGAPTLELHSEHRAPIELVPAYRAGGREHGGWRTTWFALAPDGQPVFTDEPAGAGL
jgi:DUF1680 family protein